MRLIVALALIVLVVAPATASAAPRLDSIASRIVGRSIVVTCDTPLDAAEAGSTIVGSSSISLNADACRALARARDARWVAARRDSIENADRLGAAVQLVVHESMHLALASGDEALVECTASRNYWPTIAAFHLAPRLAGRVLAAAMRTHRNLANPLYKEIC